MSRKIKPHEWFGDPAPPAARVDTSIEAAIKVLPRQRILQRRVLNCLSAYDMSPTCGLTADELGSMMNLPAQTVTPRLWELEHMGLVTKTEGRRPTRRGRTARVYRLTIRGRDALSQDGQ